MINIQPHNPDSEFPQVVTQFKHPPYQQLFDEILRDNWLVNRVDTLARPEGLRIRDIEDPLHEYPVIMCRPTLTAGILALRTQYAKAVVLVNYATGTTPVWLAPVIKQLVDNNVPVFLVPDCPGDEAGMISVKYAACIPALEAGATPIEKVNVKEIDLVKEAVRDHGERLSGRELADYIHQMFAYQEGEEPPKPEWERPEAVERYRQEIIVPFLRRLGFEPPDAESLSNQWKTIPGNQFLNLVLQGPDHKN